MSDNWEDRDDDDPPEPKHSKSEYDRHKHDLQHLDGDELIEDAVEYFVEPRPRRPIN
jgi:hypothetical protein